MADTLRLIVNPCQHERHGGEDPRICQDCGAALDIPTYEALRCECGELPQNRSHTDTGLSAFHQYRQADR